METGHFSFRLAQSAVVNNIRVLAPLSAYPLLYNEQASLVLEENILVFLWPYSNDGTVIPPISGNALSINLSSQRPGVNINFDNNTNSFYLI